jgi:poly(A) polymerase
VTAKPEDALTRLTGADWLEAPSVRKIFTALEVGGDEVRIVGGTVRNALSGLPVRDIDFATTAPPEMVAARAEAAGLKAVPTGIGHGTYTLVADGVGYEVTTLREDVETDGRHAVVRFGRDWEADARRRDFTVNALSVDSAGIVHDPLGGYADILARRVVFIGDADRRIAEDRLRILRFFRIGAEFAAGPFDRVGLDACARGRQGLRDLSAERIGQEMRRLVLAPRAAEALALMQDYGVLPVVFGGVGHVAAFERLAAFEAALGATPSVALRLAAAGCQVEEDAERIAVRLRLPNAERDLMRVAVAGARGVPDPADERAARRLLYDLGEHGFQSAVALAGAWRGAGNEALAALWRLPERWPRPRFPLAGRDVLGAGGRAGPEIGALLRSLEAWWIAEDFRPDAAALRARLQQAIAAAQ